MNKLLIATALTAAAAVAIGSPAFAETYLNEMGTGDLHPIIQQSTAPSWVDASTRRSGLDAYAMVGRPTNNSNDPALTGGGSSGYNANLLIY
jgi:hypothetical protein